MNFAEIKTALDQVEVRNGPWMMCHFQLDDLDDRAGMRLRYVPVDRDAKDRNDVCIIESQDNVRSLDSLRTPTDVTDWAFEVVRNAYLHELCEAFYVDGVRVRDPHAVEELAS